MGVAEVVATLRADTSEFTAKMGEAKAQVDKLGKAGASGFEQFASVGKAALLGIGAAAVGVGVTAIDLAENYDAARQQLEAAAKGQGLSFNQIQKAATAADGMMAKYGYTATQVEQATVSLTIAQGKHADIEKDLALAANIAAARHIDLSSAINMVNKAAEGNSSALKRMGIDLPIAAGGALKVATAQKAVSAAQEKVNEDMAVGAQAAAFGSKAYIAYHADLDKLTAAHQTLSAAQTAGTKIIDILSQRFAGQAAAAASTFSGRIKAMKAEGENLLITIGNKLIPILDQLMATIMSAVTWFDKHRAAAIALAVVVGGVVTAAITAYIAKLVLAGIESVTTFAKMVASGAAWAADLGAQLLYGIAGMIDWAVEHATMAAAFIAENVAMAASATAAFIAENAATLGIVAAIALLVGAIVYAATHWKQVWHDIMDVVHLAWTWIKQHLDLIIVAALGPLGIAIDLLKDHWNTVWNFMQTVIQTVWGVIQPIFGFFKTLGTDIIEVNIQIMRDIWNAAWQAVSTAVNIAWPIIKSVWDLIEDGISDLQTVMTGLSAAWSSIWNGLGTAITYAYNTYIAPAIAVIQDAVNAVKGAWDAVFGGGGSPAPAAAPTGAQIPHRAAGGSLALGQTALVGENGPELFTPGSSGTVIPNSALGGGGSDQPITIVVQVAGEDVGKAILPSLLKLKRTGGYGTLQLS